MNTKLIAVSATFLTLLAGCGGGGGGGSTTPQAGAGANGNAGVSPAGAGSTTGGSANGGGNVGTTVTGPRVPIDKAIAELYTTGKSYSRPNNVNGVNLIVAATYMNTGVVNTDGAATSVKRKVTRSADGSTFYESDQTDSFTTGPFKINRRVLPGQAAESFVTTSFKALPESGIPGESGDFYTANIFTSAQFGGGKIGMATYTWDISPDTEFPLDAAIFCIRGTIEVPGGTTKQSDCYKILNKPSDLRGFDIPSVLFSTPTTPQV